MSVTNPVLAKVIGSYLYQQYSDDSDLQAFRDSYNSYVQNYVDSFVALNLPIYTNSNITGALLDWVGQGVYGYPRPTLQTTTPVSIGPLNTYGPNYLLPLNAEVSTPGTAALTTDDIYKRLLTWHFYKGDGKQFTISWLKRRIMRFLTGAGGSDPIPNPAYPAISGVDFTYQINITFSGSTLNITIPTYPLASVLVAAISSGVAELPFEYSYNFTISGAVNTAYV